MGPYCNVFVSICHVSDDYELFAVPPKTSPSRFQINNSLRLLTLNISLVLSSGLFEVRAQEYLDSLPGSEQRGVNKFLKGLGEIYFKLISHSVN